MTTEPGPAMEQTPISRQDKERLLKAARAAVRLAYAPYSGFRVGAAVLTEQGAIHTGANVENASLGLTVCAERAAIVDAVAAEGPGMRVKALAVVSDRDGPLTPCGACRQVIFEFGPKALVIFRGPDGLMEKTITEILPLAFRL